MKKSDLDRLNPKQDDMNGFDFFNRGNLSKDVTNYNKQKNNLLFYLTFIVIAAISLLILLNSASYLKNYGDSLMALAITLIGIILFSLLIATLITFIYKKIKYSSN